LLRIIQAETYFKEGRLQFAQSLLNGKFLISVTLILACVQLASRVKYKGASIIPLDVLIPVLYSNIPLLRQSGCFSRQPSAGTGRDSLQSRRIKSVLIWGSDLSIWFYL